jgi:hypothetical protein
MTLMTDYLKQRLCVLGRTVSIEAANVYDALWHQIVRFLKEAREKAIDASTNGAAYNRIISVPPEN